MTATTAPELSLAGSAGKVNPPTITSSAPAIHAAFRRGQGRGRTATNAEPANTASQVTPVLLTQGAQASTGDPDAAKETLPQGKPPQGTLPRSASCRTQTHGTHTAAQRNRVTSAMPAPIKANQQAQNAESRSQASEPMMCNQLSRGTKKARPATNPVRRPLLTLARQHDAETSAAPGMTRTPMEAGAKAAHRHTPPPMADRSAYQRGSNGEPVITRQDPCRGQLSRKQRL